MQKLLSYFSFQGRANRQRYWMTSLSIFGLFFVSAVLSVMLPPPLSVIVLPLWLAIFTAGCANGVRRLHDRAHSAWWLLLFYVLPAVLSFPAELAKHGSSDDFQLAASALAMLGLPFSIWGIVVMGCLKGTEGPNKYGDDPLQPVREVFA